MVARLVTTVLLAEDQGIIRTMVAEALERHGYAVLSAEDGGEALALFRAQPAAIDVVVLDVRMPNLEGPPALCEMRAMRPALPAILMTGFTDSSEELTTLLRDGVRLVMKPFRMSALAALVVELAPPVAPAPRAV